MWPNGPELRRSRNRTGAVYRNRANWSKSNKSISFLGKLWKVESFGKCGKDGKSVFSYQFSVFSYQLSENSEISENSEWLWEGWERWEGSEEGFAALRELHTGLAADSCCKTSSSASRFKERGGGEGCDGSRSIGETGRWC